MDSVKRVDRSWEAPCMAIPSARSLSPGGPFSAVYATEQQLERSMKEVPPAARSFPRDA